MRKNQAQKPGAKHDLTTPKKKAPVRVLFPVQLLRLGSSAVFRHELFLDPSRLARTFAQVVQLRTTHIAATLHDNARQQRRVGLERTLDAFARRNLADDEIR